MGTRSVFAWLTTGVSLLVTAAALGANEQYTVSPRASDATKAAVAAGQPPAHGFPEIHNIQMSSTDIRAGAFVDGTVDTSPNVGYVEARIKYHNIALDRAELGHFVLHYKAPLLPPFLIGTWNLQIIARSVDGVEVKRSVPIRYHY